MAPKKETPRFGKKRPYRAPKLTVHGDLKALAKAKGGASSDGSKPASRASGAPG